MNAPCRYGEFAGRFVADALGRASRCTPRTSGACTRRTSRLDGAELVLERALGRGLQVDVERGVDLEALLVELLPELLLELLADPLDEVRRDVARFRLRRASWSG